MLRVHQNTADASRYGTRWPRHEAERLLLLARELPPADRLLLEQSLAYRTPLRILAAHTGRHTSTLARRILRLLSRLRTPAFAFLAAHHDLLPPATRRTAQLIIFEGRSQRQTARITGQSLHTIRRQIAVVYALSRT